MRGPPAALPLPSHGSNFSRAAVARRGRPLVSAGPRVFLGAVAVPLRAGGARPAALPAGVSRVGPALGGSSHPQREPRGWESPGRAGRREAKPRGASRASLPCARPGLASPCSLRPATRERGAAVSPAWVVAVMLPWKGSSSLCA